MNSSKHWEFQETEHRPFPMPDSNWAMTQVWNDVFFAHWPCEPEKIKKLLPESIELDTFNGTAWISLVSFHITDFRFRYLPPIPHLNFVPELNVRTYVINKGIPSIYFFSLDTTRYSAVLGARLGTGLPYRKAKMGMETGRDRHVTFKSSFTKAGNQEDFRASYQPGPKMYEPEKESLEFWLLERYRLYSFQRNQLVYIDIHHDQWKISDVRADIKENTMAPCLLPQTDKAPSLMHYARRRHCFFYPIKKA
ncbi:YqjF family protein [Bacillus massiliglaciei]|uniref:YqjF family protein n=1 Tax=Bacillus massiliglaciei TaxID=1816693 RepID=UPI000DA5EFCE|nr:DUF2071 domain-containing protein [Bacillus massiliglaciei]